MVTGLVIDCLGTNDFLVDKIYLLLLPCNLLIVLFSQSTSSFILVLGKANVKVCVELYRWLIELEGIFVLLLAPHWVRHSYLSKEATIEPLYLWVIKTFFWRRCRGVIAWGVYSRVCLFALSPSSFIFCSKLFSISSYGYGTQNTKKSCTCYSWRWGTS